MNVGHKHCCEEMSAHLTANELYLSYSSKFREYGIHYREGLGGGRQVIRDCPWCGEALPPPMRDAWFDEMDRLGINPDGEVPSQYLSDDWWKNRERN